uniref:Uncharacterized protein n=1 Tax=Cucumis melo TaxID=3656 RepID=A0A9I9DI77_CUCME
MIAVGGNDNFSARFILRSSAIAASTSLPASSTGE